MERLGGGASGRLCRGRFAGGGEARDQAGGVAHLVTLEGMGQSPRGSANVSVLRYDAGQRRQQTRVRFVGLGALLGRTTSPAKAAAARRNGQKGGRPVRAVQRQAN